MWFQVDFHMIDYLGSPNLSRVTRPSRGFISASGIRYRIELLNQELLLACYGGSDALKPRFSLRPMNIYQKKFVCFHQVFIAAIFPSVLMVLMLAGDLDTVPSRTSQYVQSTSHCQCWY
jgi:hypothetical protein